jgi:hypothetical protein
VGRISSRLTYANVMSTLALFAALGGGAYAASKFVAPSGVVDLCVSKSGAVKVLPAKKSKCGKGASLVPINQQGPAGKQGPAGTGGSGQAYSAGPGLTLAGTSFGADLTKLQARIAGSGCAGDQALQSVAQDGTPGCTSLHAHASPPNTGSNTTVGTGVPAGTWLLLGQARGTYTPNSPDSGIDMICSLQAGNQIVDTVNQTILDSDTATLAPIATVTTTGASTAVDIQCTYNPHLTIGNNLAIVAVPLAALN